MLRLALILLFLLILLLPNPLRAADPVLVASLSKSNAREAFVTSDGKFLVTHHYDYPPTIWDVASGLSIRQLGRRTEKGKLLSNPNSIALSRDGSRALVSYSPDTYLLYEIPSGKILKEFTGRPATGWIALSPDATLAASSDGKANISLWNIADGKEIKKIPADRGGLSAVHFSPDGKQIVSDNSTESQINVYEIDIAKKVQEYGNRVHPKIMHARFTPEGRSLVTGAADGGLLLWNPDTGDILGNFVGHTGGINSIDFSADGRFFISSSSDNTARLWDFAARKQKARVKYLCSNRARFMPDGKSFLCYGSDLRIFDFDGKIIRNFSSSADKPCIADWSPDASRFFLTAEDRTLRMWDIAAGREIYRLADVREHPKTCVFSPDSSTLLTATYNNTINLHDAATGKLIREIKTFTSQRFSYQEGDRYIYSLCFAPDGKSIALTHKDSVHILNAATGEKISTFSFAGKDLQRAVFAADGKRLIISPDSEAILICDAATGKKIHTIKQKYDFADFNISPDTSLISLIHASRDAVSIYNTDTAKLVIEIKSDIPVYQCDISTDNKTILTSTYHGGARIIEIATGKTLHTLAGQSVFWAKFSPNGKHILTPSNDSTTRLWEAATGKHLATLHTFNDNSWAVTAPNHRFDTNDPQKNPNLHWVEGDTPHPLEKFSDKYYTPKLLPNQLK